MAARTEPEPFSLRPHNRDEIMKRTQIAAAVVALTLSVSGPATASQHSQVHGIQQMLTQCGFDPGPLDGRWGRQTAEAAAQFVRAHGGEAEDPLWVQASDPDYRADLIAQVESHRSGSSEPCPSPNSEIWECSTLFESSELMLTADHDAGAGTVKMGSIPTIGTHFAVNGLDRVWIWPDNREPPGVYQFLIGPRDTLGLRGFYLHFPHSKLDEMVESKASYSCEQIAGR